MVNFVDQWEWSRIGLIRDDTPYYHHAAELLHKKLTGTTRTITPVLTVTKVGGTSVLRQVKDYGTHIFILSMGGDTALLHGTGRSREAGLLLARVCMVGV